MLIIIPKNVFKTSRLIGIIGIFIYFLVYFTMLYFNNLAQQIGVFTIYDGIILVVILYIILYRPFTFLLVQKRDLIEFELIYRMLFLALFSYYLILRSIPIKFTLVCLPENWILTVIFTLLLITVDLFIALKFGFLEFYSRKIKIDQFFILLVYMFFFVALTQEIFFRGLVFGYLSQFCPGGNYLIPLLISSILFGIAHVNYGGKQLVYLATVAGVFYGIIFISTSNIFYSTLSHTIVNIIWKALFRPKS